MEWQTPAVSEKFQSRFGRPPGPADDGDTAVGAVTSDPTEDFCRSGNSPSFQPIRSQIPIPTAHVMPSTAASASKPHLCVPEGPQASAEPHRPLSGSRTSSSSSSKSSSLSKSASSPNLDTQIGGGSVDPAGSRPDCLSRFRSLVNGLDHSLFPTGDHSRFDDGQRFDTPTVEPTLNQTALLAGMCPTALGDGLDRGPGAYKGSMENSYKVLPEARPSALGAAEACRGGQAGGAAGFYPGPLQAQLMSAGVGPYPSLYPPSLHPESGKWDALMKANEGLLKEKELVIERQKQHMAQLEQRLRDSELHVHGALLGRGAPRHRGRTPSCGRSSLSGRTAPPRSRRRRIVGWAWRRRSLGG
ncbi:hypothetical protein CRUP_000259 [Coryphaenoides rupestris]|nr:hypothetical protein CRUP_000259 [Coryphaenoides rupestris]